MGLCLYACVSQLRLSYAPLRNNPKFLVTYNKKDLFLAQAVAHFHIILWAYMERAVPVWQILVS